MSNKIKMGYGNIGSIWFDIDDLTGMDLNGHPKTKRCRVAMNPHQSTFTKFTIVLDMTFDETW